MEYWLRNSLYFILLILLGCGQSGTNVPSGAVSKGEIQKTSEGAVLMRSMEQLIKLHGQAVAENKSVPIEAEVFKSFKTCQLTDSTVRDAGFKLRVDTIISLLHAASNNRSKEVHNSLVNYCVKCHENYCPGPISRIKKLKVL